MGLIFKLKKKLHIQQHLPEIRYLFDDKAQGKQCQMTTAFVCVERFPSHPCKHELTEYVSQSAKCNRPTPTRRNTNNQIHSLHSRVSTGSWRQSRDSQVCGNDPWHFSSVATECCHVEPDSGCCTQQSPKASKQGFYDGYFYYGTFQIGGITHCSRNEVLFEVIKRHLQKCSSFLYIDRSISQLKKILDYF